MNQVIAALDRACIGAPQAGVLAGFGLTKRQKNVQVMKYILNLMQQDSVFALVTDCADDAACFYSRLYK